MCHSVRARQHSLRQLTRCTLKISYLTISSIYNTISTYGVVLQLFPTPFSANRAHNSSDRGFSASPICQGLETIQNPIHHEAQLRCLVALAEFWLDTRGCFTNGSFLPKSLGIIESHQTHYGAWWGLWVAIGFLRVFRIPKKLGNTTSLRSGVTANLSDSRGKEVVLAGSIHFKCPCWSHPDHLVALCCPVHIYAQMKKSNMPSA